MTRSTAPAPLGAARKLAPQIRAAADEIDATRELPRPLFEAIADAGLFCIRGEWRPDSGTVGKGRRSRERTFR